MTDDWWCYSLCYSETRRSIECGAKALVRGVGLSGLEPLTSALSERSGKGTAERAMGSESAF